MRVTFQTAYGNIEHVNVAAGQMARAREQVQTGKRIQAPSDDPAAMQRAIEGRAQIAGVDTYVRTADSATAKLATLDTVLTNVVDLLTQAQVAAMSVRGSVADQQSRDAAALTLEGLRDALVADLNTTFRGAYVFGGTESLTPPYAQVAGAWTYQGSTTPVRVDVGPGRTVQVALDGQALAQGSDATNVLNELETLIVAVRAGDSAAIGVGIAAMERAFNRAVRVQSQIGVDQQGLAERQAELSATRLAALTRVSRDEDVNLAEAIAEMNRAQVAYEAALGAVGSASRVSLVDYL